MATESVEILIEADNRASAKFKQVNKDMEASVKNIREVGGKAKASTELVGTLANTLGGTAIGGFAGEVAMATERISAFSEVAKEGGVGARAFQAGLAGVVGVAGFKFGKFLGNAIFHTEEWTKALEKAAEKAGELDARLQAIQAGREGEALARLQAIANLEDRRVAAAEERKRLATELAGIERRILTNERERARVEGLKGEFAITRNPFTGAEILANRGRTEELTELIRKDQELLVVRQQQAQTLQEIAVGERDRIAASKKSDAFVQGLRDELEILKATNAERIAIEAARGTANNDDRNEAIRLMQERDAILAKQEAQKQADREREQAQQRLLRMQEQAAAADIRAKEGAIRAQMSVLDGLRMQVVELQYGKRAAQELALVSKGFSRGDASALAGIMQQLAGGDGFSLSTGVQARQSRLLTRGRDDIAMKTEKNTALSAKELRRIRTHIETQQQQIIELQRGNV